jgi:ATP-binding cassette subfamily C protein/ATP-binding cassette subfamily C exporter for protease/lipase/ATP-binding cassette subfamily C protein EexD
MRPLHAQPHAAQPNDLQIAMSSCRSVFLTAFLFSLVINVLMLASPIYMLQVYDRVLTTRSVETLIFLTAIVGGALLLMAWLDTLRNTLMVRCGGWLNDRLGPIFLQSSVRARLAGDYTGAQPLRDIAQIQHFISTQGLTAFFDAPWVPIFIALIWILHPILGLVALASALVLLLLSLVNELATRNPSNFANNAQMKSYQEAEVTIRNAEVVSAMGMMPALTERWRARNATVNDALRFAGERGGAVLALTKFTRFFVQVAILGMGAWLVIKAELTPGGMIAASILLGRALAPVEMAIGAWRGFMSTRMAYDRLLAHLKRHPPVGTRTRLPAPSGVLEVDQLTWFSPSTGEPILRRVTFHVEPGEAVAVIGPSGAGKSTLCRLLSGLVPPSNGVVRLDGSELRHWDALQLGRHVGFLPQDVELFPGTVRENIARMTTDEDDEAVLRAARLAHAHDMIQRLPDSYDTPVGEGGVMLSGGQRQRVGLARAVYGDPSLIILDEPNANLDQEGEAALAAALRHLKAQGAALIIVGHRPSTIAEADKILLLKDGCVALFGTRDDVLKELSQAAASSGEPEAVPIKRNNAPSVTQAKDRDTSPKEAALQ